jgi:hypothetical protein
VGPPIDDPVLRATIRRRARQIAEELTVTPYDPDTVGLVRSLLGPVPRAGRDDNPAT